MHAIFIADAHLRNPEDRNYRTMLRFLEGLPGNTEILVIAGDFFEFWLGDSPSAFPHYEKVLKTLETVTHSGIKLIFIEGNHDFHLKGYFQRAFDADVFPESTALTLDGKRIFICHGDRINRADISYRVLRFLFRNPLTRLLARIVPSSIPALIAEKLGNHSKGKHQTVASKWDGKQLAKVFAESRFSDGYDVVVTAHYHDPFLEQKGEKTLLALGDWITQFSYGEWNDGELTLKTYQPDSL
jgi:UDP-2,3-diacylglucosamine hydrolase